jgi:hypothetical protein
MGQGVSRRLAASRPRPERSRLAPPQRESSEPEAQYEGGGGEGSGMTAIRASVS